MTDVIEDEVTPPGSTVSPAKALVAQGAGVIVIVFATACGFFFSQDSYVRFAVVLAPLVAVAAWIIWRALDRRAWLALLPAVVISFLVAATYNAAPWSSVFYANTQLAWDTPITGAATVGEMASGSFGRLVLLIIMSAIGIVAAEGIHALENRPARTPMAILEPVADGTSEVLKQVGTTEDGKPLYVTVSGPGPATNRHNVTGTNMLAVLALVFGLAGGLPAIPLGHIALHQIKRTRESGRGMAIAGLVLGYVWVAVIAIYFIVVAVAFAGVM
jgi:hypothetical protein